MKIIMFLDKGIATIGDIEVQMKLRSEGHKVSMSNGSVTKGFQDSCDAIVMCGDFPHIKEWAELKGVKVLGEEKKEEEAPKPKRGRKPKEASKTEE